MIKPNPETRNVIVEVYVDVPFDATKREIEDSVERCINAYPFWYGDVHVTDIEAKENRGESE